MAARHHVLLLYVMKKQNKHFLWSDINMAVDFEIWLHILSNSITLWTNIICDMIEHPEREVYINLSREFYRTFIQQPNRRI